jgi:hypothetical protein
VGVEEEGLCNVGGRGHRCFVLEGNYQSNVMHGNRASRDNDKADTAA